MVWMVACAVQGTHCILPWAPGWSSFFSWIVNAYTEKGKLWRKNSGCEVPVSSVGIFKTSNRCSCPSFCSSATGRLNCLRRFKVPLKVCLVPRRGIGNQGSTLRTDGLKEQQPWFLGGMLWWSKNLWAVLKLRLLGGKKNTLWNVVDNLRELAKNRYPMYTASRK